MSKADYKNPIPSKSQHALIVQQLGLKLFLEKFQKMKNSQVKLTYVRNIKSTARSFAEAIRVLNAKGLTYSRPKIGTVVRPKEEWHLLDRCIVLANSNHA